MGSRTSLPSVRSLRDLAEICGPYPIRVRHVVLAAQRYCYGEAMVNFLEEFPPDQTFLDREELMAHCMALRDHLSLRSYEPPMFMERFFRRRLHMI